MSKKEKKYVIDANILMGFARWHPFGIRDEFWKDMAKYLMEGKYILIDDIHFSFTLKNKI